MGDIVTTVTQWSLSQISKPTQNLTDLYRPISVLQNFL